MKKKHFVRNWILGTSLAVSIAGVGSFLTYFFLNQHFNHIEKEKNNVPLKNIGAIQKNESPVLKHLTFNQYPILKKDGTQGFQFSDNEMKKIIDRFVTEVPFGPEVNGLKNITFNDVSLINGSGINGVYYPQTNQIGISTTSILKDSDLLGSDEKIDQVFQVMYHEYGHHLFYTYASSMLNKEHAIVIDGQQINKNFYEWFRDDFNYGNGETTKLTSIANDFNGRILGEPYIPVSTTYSLKELYEHSNEGKNLKGDDKAKLDYFYYDKNIGPYIGNGSLVNFPVEKADHESLKYTFSLQELLTRKFQLSTMSFSDAAKNTTNPRHPDYVYTKGLSQYYGVHTNVMSQDINHYSSLLLKKRFQNDETIGKNWNTILSSITGVPSAQNTSMREEDANHLISYFYKDNPFLMSKYDNTKQVAEVFSKKVGDMMGQQRSSELSYINSKNTLEIQRSKEDKTSAVDSKSEVWKKDQGNEIIVGGYLDHTKSYFSYFNANLDQPKFLAIKTGVNPDKYTKISDILVTKKDLKAKSKPYEADPTKDIAGSDYFWTTNYFNAQNIENKLLYLAFKGNLGEIKYYPITSYKGMDAVAETGASSNWLSSYPISVNRETNLWKFANDPGTNYPILKNEGKYGQR